MSAPLDGETVVLTMLHNYNTAMALTDAVRESGIACAVEFANGGRHILRVARENAPMARKVMAAWEQGVLFGQRKEKR